MILVNAAFALVQERQAERAVEALRAYLPTATWVIRDGDRTSIPAAELVPGDLMLVEEGGRISADARLLTGAVEVDMSPLTGESMAVERVASDQPPGLDPLAAPNLVFSGTACTGGEAQAIVLATGMQTQLGRVASLSAGVRRDRSPLERQITRVAWLIALIGCVVSAAFVPIGILAGLDPTQGALFAIGLLVANVPEGLLPTITLALATGARELARKGALVKRLSAVETLGSASVICTDKTGTLTRNRMRVVEIWTEEGAVPVDPESSRPAGAVTVSSTRLLEAAVYCSNAEPGGDESAGDATEVAIVLAAAGFCAGPTSRERAAARDHLYHFDPALRMMSSVDRMPTGLVLHAKGAPEEVLRRCDGLSDLGRAAAHRAIQAYAERGLRVLAVADRALPAVPEHREAAERDLRFLGLVAMVDPPRPEVAAAVADCHRAGIRIIVITGDHGLTASRIARQVGICRGEPIVVTGEELAQMHDDQLEAVLGDSPEVLFARSSPDAKLRTCEALRRQGHVVAMTGDGVNDAPALRRADLGVAMGVSGTDVAREAATMVLTDDNFAHIVAAIEEGRRIYDNVRKLAGFLFVLIRGGWHPGDATGSGAPLHELWRQARR